ncbi:MAG TPA: CHRD domain-containing protein [Chthoniobacteraceae bacterium]|nr:CHRD domain-containing protein [Chthoniobacteraceae bacterium]
MNALTKIAAIAAFIASALSANAAIINLDLLGKAGPGLLPGNENFTINGVPGSGGEVGAGIFFNDVTLSLTINIAWGSANGFTNLTGNAIDGHIHGPTLSGGTASFLQNASVAIGFPALPGGTWNPSASGGSFSGSVTLNSTQATQLLEGKFYINIHTSANSGGEIRGNIVPEPTSLVLLSLGVVAMARRHR